MNSALKLPAEEYTYKISVIIPMLNEAETILFVLNKLKDSLKNQNYEVIVVDDGSTDQSSKNVQSFIAAYPEVPIQYYYQENRGKGGAVKTGFAKAQGEIIIIQDADMEYEPKDLLDILPEFDRGAKVVYGSRNMHPSNRDHSSLFFYWGGLLVTWATNLLFGSKLTDEATGYKVFHASVLKALPFQHNDFAWEPEITAKILKNKIPIVEKPISYRPRTVAEGKKISWTDGVKALAVLITEFIKK